MSFAIYSLATMAARIDQPYSMVTVGLVGHIGVNVTVAQGQVDWHKHIDEDELFLVHEGGLRVETELGKSLLYPSDLLLVPKGVGHKSSSSLRSTIIIFRQQILPERKNGYRTYLVTDDREPLAKAQLSSFVNENSEPYVAATAAAIEGFQLSVFLASGFGSTEDTPNSGTLLYVTQGALGLELNEGGGIRLDDGQLTILPPHTRYKMQATTPTVVVKFEHE